jgi:hypothetical protein
MSKTCHHFEFEASVVATYHWAVLLSLHIYDEQSQQMLPIPILSVDGL